MFDPWWLFLCSSLCDTFENQVLLSRYPEMEDKMKRLALIILLLVVSGTTSWGGQYLGNLSSNPYNQNSTANQFGAGNPYGGGINNPYSQHGNQFSNKSANNPYAADAPKLYDSQGNYRGKLSTNQFDPDSVSNPYGRYGNQFSPDSINNPFGAGNPYSQDSPNNPYGQGPKIIGQ